MKMKLMHRNEMYTLLSMECGIISNPYHDLGLSGMYV